MSFLVTQPVNNNSLMIYHMTWLDNSCSSKHELKKL
jgi:hypothetical protein